MGLDAAQRFRLTGSDARSISNGNELFAFTADLLGLVELAESDSLVLVHSGVAYPVTITSKRWKGGFLVGLPYSGGSLRRYRNLSLYWEVQGKAQARQLAEHLDAEIVYRTPREHLLRISFAAAQRMFSTGEEILATMRILNEGLDPVKFKRRGHRGRIDQYSFSAMLGGEWLRDIGLRGRADDPPPITLGPGEAFEDQVSLGEWFAFDEPGLYSLVGSYRLLLYEPGNGNDHTIWEEDLSAPFEVRIQ